MRVVKYREQWALSHEQEYHVEALESYGERVAIRRVFDIEHFVKGEAVRCSDCYAGSTKTVQERMADVYSQPGEAYCMTCFGTSYVGGFESTVYIAFMLAQGDGTTREQKATGVMTRKTPPVQFSPFPPMKQGDLVVRAKQWSDDGLSIVEEDGRYICNVVSTVKLHTGPGRPGSELYLGQTAEIDNIPRKHPYQEVPVS